MESTAYMAGAISVLVKSGELSPEYAAGFMDAVEKQAGLISDTSFEDTAKAYREWEKAHPGQKITGPEARQLMREHAHNWYNIGQHDNTGFWSGFGHMLGKGWNSVRNLGPEGWRSDYTNEMRDRAYENEQNLGQLSRVKEWEADKKMLPAEFAAALQDEHMEKAKFVVEDAKNYMGDSDRESAGLTDGYADQFRTTQGQLGADAGLYKPKNYTAKSQIPDTPGYGKNVSNQYGANKSLVYNRNYYDPTAI